VIHDFPPDLAGGRPSGHPQPDLMSTFLKGSRR
jgi:hypothetical protein